MTKKQSAGLLLYRRNKINLEVFLYIPAAHSGKIEMKEHGQFPKENSKKMKNRYRQPSGSFQKKRGKLFQADS